MDGETLAAISGPSRLLAKRRCPVCTRHYQQTPLELHLFKNALQTLSKDTARGDVAGFAVKENQVSKNLATAGLCMWTWSFSPTHSDQWCPVDAQWRAETLPASLSTSAVKNSLRMLFFGTYLDSMVRLLTTPSGSAPIVLSGGVGQSVCPPVHSNKRRVAGSHGNYTAERLRARGRTVTESASSSVWDESVLRDSSATHTPEPRRISEWTGWRKKPMPSRRRKGLCWDLQRRDGSDDANYPSFTLNENLPCFPGHLVWIGSSDGFSVCLSRDALTRIQSVRLGRRLPSPSHPMQSHPPPVQILLH